MHVTIPSAESIGNFGTVHKKIDEVFKIRGTKFNATDYAIVNGQAIDVEDGCFEGQYWATVLLAGYVNILKAIVHTNVESDINNIGIMPVLINDDEELSNIKFKESNDGIFETYYSEYPQKAAPGLMQEKLESAYEAKILKIENYTLSNPMCPKEKQKRHTVYNFEGKRYIRTVMNSFFSNRKKLTMLSNGEKYKNGDIVWIEIMPIKWLRLNDDNLISEKILFSGLEITKSSALIGYEISELYNYLNDQFIEDIKNLKPSENLINKEINKKVNPYNFNFGKVTEEEIIKGALLSDIPVFLHGASGDGKSARVKQFDEDATIIYLRNSSLESFNGKSVYNSETGEMIDIMPSWLKKVYEKCEKEPNKLHIVFFDEINNASNVIQGMAFNVVLNKEVNGIWKLPENARIVAAGNEMKDSLSAEELSEPLFNRFAHVYINTTTEDWLKWATTPAEEYERLDNVKVINEYKVHPSIYAYIAYKLFMKKSVLRTKYNGITPNADPRKWEMASKVLYATGRPDMLRSLIGKELTKDFIEFTKKEVITVEDVINHNYDETITDELNLAEKYNLAVGLSVVDKENLEIVRDFVYNIGREIGAIFDTLWTHGNEERLEYLLEIESKKQDNKKETSIKEVENLSFTFIDVDSEEIKNLYLFKRLDAEITDFALCTGGIYADIEGVNNGYYWTLTHKNLSSNYGPIDESTIVAVDSEGEEIAVYINKNAYSARPLLINASSYEAVNKFLGNHYITDDHKPVIEFGEYPQDAVSLGMQNKLKKLYKENKLELTENYYTIYDNKSYDKTSPNLEDLNKQITFEYIYNGKKYVRVNGNFADGGATLSNDNSYEDGEEIWIEVKPIEWYLYKNENGEYCLLSLKLLFSGVPFSTKKNYDGDFENTFIKEFMDEEFSKDILRGQYLTKENENVKALKK